MWMHALEHDARPRRLFSFKDSSEGRFAGETRKCYYLHYLGRVKLINTDCARPRGSTSGGTLGARVAGRSLREGTNLERADDAATLGLGLEERAVPSRRVGVNCASLAKPTPGLCSRVFQLGTGAKRRHERRSAMRTCKP
jgi:hypothetical protein